MLYFSYKVLIWQKVKLTLVEEKDSLEVLGVFVIEVVREGTAGVTGDNVPFPWGTDVDGGGGGKGRKGSGMPPTPFSSKSSDDE